MTANNEQIHISALFSDETESFRIPIEPEPFSNVTCTIPHNERECGFYLFGGRQAEAADEKGGRRQYF